MCATCTWPRTHFQAVFLVLARKARFIRDAELLGNWLYGVAVRTPHKAIQFRLSRIGEIVILID
jgi:hypothetical protein